MTDAEGRTTSYEYDGLGRVSAVRLPGQDAAPLTYQYDALGNLRVAADQLGRQTQYEYDSLRRVVKEIDQNGDATIFHYDALGRLATLVDPELNATTWAYNAAGQLESVTNELAQTRSYLYDEFNRLVQATDRNLRVTTYQYDNLHRLRTEKWYADQSHLNSSPGSPLHAISFDFDDAGQLTAASDAFAEYDYDYDDLGRVTKVIASLAGLTPEITFDREYDALRLTASGARIGATAGEGGTADYRNDCQFDRLGRATQIVQSANGGHAVAAKRVDLGYDRLSRFTSVERYASVDASAPVVDTSFSYDLIGRITQIDHAGVVAHGYEWDASNRLTQYAGSVDGAVDYAYDQRGQLTGVDYVGNWQTDESYQYDDNGNRELATNDAGADQDYEAGGDNRLAGDGAFAYEYDAEGNRIARYIDNDSNGFLSTGDADVTQYEWDHRNRLAKVIERASHGGTIAASGFTTNPHRWVGRLGYYFDAGLDSHYVRQRHFRSVIAAWLNRDRLDVEIVLHNVMALGLYIYAASNPLSRSDPSGLQPLGISYEGQCECGEHAAMLAAVGPIDAYKALLCRDEAFVAAAATGLPGRVGGAQDAFRHCYWNCCMRSRGISRRDTIQIGDIHEECGSPLQQTSEDRCMDLHNNRWAIDEFERLQRLGNVSCDAMCKDLLDRGRLITRPSCRSNVLEPPSTWRL